ncbi:MAG: YARHG domain-containing protein [Bacteroidota bacterium]|nr:YARHG domain-containing protein [Bacteroidota bacterium]
MKLNLLFNCLSALLFMSACGDAKKTEEEQPMHINDTAKIDEGDLALIENTTSPLSETNPLLGFYVGGFIADIKDESKLPMYMNKINISVDSIKNDILFGHSVVAGNNRPFKGNILQKENIYTAQVKEPGDDKYDGVFTFTIDANEKTLSGTWTANDKKLPVTKRNYNLKQREFRYDPSKQIVIDYRIEIYDPHSVGKDVAEIVTSDAAQHNASTETLKKEDVENMYKRDLEIMRNAIYARHGYTFQNRQMRYFFDTEVDWYIPVSTNITKELTELEKQNIKLIKSYEDYASAYYDGFGR